MSAKTVPPPPKPKQHKVPATPPTPVHDAEVVEVPAKTTHRKWKIFFISTATIILLFLATATTYAFYYSSRYLPHTVIGGVAIGGMTQSEAQLAVGKKEKAFLNQDVALVYQGKQWTVKPVDIHSTLDTEAALASVWQDEKGGSFIHQLHFLSVAPFVHQNSGLNISVFDEAGQASLQDKVFSQIESAAQETSLNFSANPVAIVEGKAGQKVNLEQFKHDFNLAFATDTFHIVLTLLPFKPEVTVAMAEPARAQAQQIIQNPVTVKLGDTGKTVTLSSTDLINWLTTTVAHDVNGVTTGLTLGFKKDTVTTSITTWSLQVNQSARNAQLQHNGAEVSVAVADQPGQSLDPDATFIALNQLLTATTPLTTITALVQSVPAAVRADNLAALGLVSLIGTNTTNFNTSPVNRIANITTGGKALNGILVNDGQTFSTISNLAPIDAAHGYLPELVIKGNSLVDEAGGGLCQVSTTLFRAVLNAGLPIVERQNHSFRVSYYEVGTGPGLDATIYDPNPDFKWKNDTGHPVYVQSSMNGKNITFDLYGTSDGRSSVIGSPQILATYPVGPPEYINTPTLDKGVTKQIEHAVNGAKVSVTYTVTRNGQKIIDRTFISNYVAWPAQYEVGTREPAPVATPTPDPGTTN